MATKTDEQIAQPGAAGTRAQMAFQGPDTNVRVEGMPRRIGFETLTKPREAKKSELMIPPSLRGNFNFEIGPIMSYETKAEKYGQYLIKINKSMAGPHGYPLEAGDEVEVDGSTAMVLCSGTWTDENGDKQPTAVFLNSKETEEELKWLAEAEAKGFKLEFPKQPYAARPEMKDVLARKRKGFVGSTLDPALAKP